MVEAAGASTARWKALAALLAGACVIGLAPILVRLTETGPASAGFWRLLLALPLLALLARGGGGLTSPAPMALAAGVLFALDLAFWHYGIANTSVANATVLSNLTPVVVTLVAWVFFGQRPRLMFVGAIALAVGGAWLLAVGRPGAAASQARLLGDLLSVATAFWYALYMLAVSAARDRDGAMKVMFWSTLVAAPLMLLAALALGEEVLPASAAGWAACIGLGLVHVAGQGSIAWALGRLPAPTASVVVLVQPVVAAILGWMLFSEALGPWQAAGAVLALAGVLLAQASAQKRSAEGPSG